MARFYLPPENWERATLDEHESRHLTQVLRLRPGDAITVFDGCGKSAPAVVRDARKNGVSLELGEPVASPPLSPTVALVQAIPKGKNMDLIVQKSVELGVAEIHPVLTRNTIVQPGDSKADKWRRTALEACKQCGQNHLPGISDATDFSRNLEKHRESSGLKLIASLAPGARPLREVLANSPVPVNATIAIGPEGDFTSEETGMAFAAGFLPVSLGGSVLRVETAALFCISALRYQYG